MEWHDELHELISNHLEDLRDNRLPQIQKAMGLTIDEIREVWSYLRKLNPKPGAGPEQRHQRQRAQAALPLEPA